MTRIEIVKVRHGATPRVSSARHRKRALQRRKRVIYASLPLRPFAAAVTGRISLSAPPALHSIPKKRSHIIEIIAKMKDFFK